MRDKDYNERKIEVLRFAAKINKCLTPKILESELDISYENAKQLLYHYRKQKLLTRRNRISQRGRDRLTYLEQRLEITEVTGIDIGLNHHRRLPCPVHEIFRIYRACGGEVYPNFSL